MKFKVYTFNFKGGEITVRAFNEEQARILAQSEAIRRGWDYAIQDHSTEKSEKANEWLHSDIDDLIDMEYPTEEGVQE